MAIQIARPFESYVAEDELPRTGDGRTFKLHVPYEIRTSSWQMEWRYSGTQEAIDQEKGVDGLGDRRKRATAMLRAAIEKDLRSVGDTLYEVEGRTLLIRGSVRQRRL